MKTAVYVNDSDVLVQRATANSRMRLLAFLAALCGILTFIGLFVYYRYTNNLEQTGSLAIRICPGGILMIVILLVARKIIAKRILIYIHGAGSRFYLILASDFGNGVGYFFKFKSVVRPSIVALNNPAIIQQAEEDAKNSLITRVVLDYPPVTSFDISLSRPPSWKARIKCRRISKPELIGFLKNLQIDSNPMTGLCLGLQRHIEYQLNSLRDQDINSKEAIKKALQAMTDTDYYIFRTILSTYGYKIESVSIKT